MLEVLEEFGVEVGVDGDLAADGEGLSLEGEKDFLDVLFGERARPRPIADTASSRAP